MSFIENLQNQDTLFISQKYEMAELIGFETRNKYQIKDQNGMTIGFAAEQQKGLLSFVVRQFLGHWRSFEIYIFDNNRQTALRCVHPFRFYFNRFEIYNDKGQRLGSLERRFSIFNRRFDVLGPNDNLIFEMISPLFRIWIFKFILRDKEVARIEKKWAGILGEAFTDKDNFKLSIHDKNITSPIRALLLAASLFVDLMYFEVKAK